MDFRTKLILPPSKYKIHHKDAILLLGSCFIENMSARLMSAGFGVDVNPFGIVYNPSSMGELLRFLMSEEMMKAEDLFLSEGLYHSFSHHSEFSNFNMDKALQNMNCRLLNSRLFLKKADVLIITFGTAYAYSLKSTGSMVSNCHKLPDKLFYRRRLSIDEIVVEWQVLLAYMRRINPNLRCLFTVSPIRHLKDGLHENSLSKSTLLLAVDALVQDNDFCTYFPAYEILLDDLRDYRFYAEDMLHPSAMAVDYIWNIFSQSFFDQGSLSLISEWGSLQKRLQHRSFNPYSQQHKEFVLATKNKIEAFLQKNPSFKRK
ncbi:hypothetical protein AwDysgo_08560 [Bacteroidales bacterium]|nr:hypothetical protein AwDysgo_08560 [Bacteroidales bacterium]